MGKATASAVVMSLLSGTMVQGQQAVLVPVLGASVSSEAMAEREVCLNAGGYVLGVRALDLDPEAFPPVTWGILTEPESREDVAGAILREGGPGWGWSMFTLYAPHEEGRHLQGCYLLWIVNAEARIWRLAVDLDQAIHNKIVSFIRGIEANLGSRSHLTPDSRTLSADAKRSESPRWR